MQSLFLQLSLESEASSAFAYTWLQVAVNTSLLNMKEDIFLDETSPYDQGVDHVWIVQVIHLCWTLWAGEMEMAWRLLYQFLADGLRKAG